METTVPIAIPEDFRQACEIFDVKPADIIQSFVEKLSIPVFYGNPNNKKKWPMLIFFDYLDEVAGANEQLMEFHTPFMTAVLDIAATILEENIDDSETAEKATRNVINLWHRAALKRRSTYLLDDLPRKE